MIAVYYLILPTFLVSLPFVFIEIGESNSGKSFPDAKKYCRHMFSAYIFWQYISYFLVKGDKNILFHYALYLYKDIYIRLF